MPRKKIKLSTGKDEGRMSQASIKKREKTRLRTIKYRQKLKQDTKKLRIVHEKNRKRTKQWRENERQNRDTDPEYKKLSQAIFRLEKDNERNKLETVTWNEFLQNPVEAAGPSKRRITSQKLRRRKERRDVMLLYRHEKNLKENYRRKVKSLRVQLARMDNKRNASQMQKSYSSGMPPKKKTRNDTHGIKLAGKNISKTEQFQSNYQVQKRSIKKRRRDQKRRQIASQKQIWKFRVENYLCRDLISRSIPGSTIIDKRFKNALRQKKQRHGLPVTKRVLRNDMSTLYTEFMKEYPLFPYKESEFKKMKPIYIITFKKGTKKEKCICIEHSNLERKLRAINRFLRSHNYTDLILPSTEALLKKTLCPHEEQPFAQADCISRTCKQCGPEMIMAFYADAYGLEAIRDEKIVWTKWCNVSRSKLNKRTGLEEIKKYNEVIKQETTFEELIVQTVEALKSFSGHTFRTRWQWNQLHSLRDNLPEDHVIMIMDFAENIKVEFSEETIASHSKAYSATLFPIAIYRHTNDKGVVIENVNVISNDSKHDSHAVHKFTEVAIKHIREKYPEKSVKAIHRFSDGCAGQFRSRHVMRDVAAFEDDYKIHFDVSYGETSEFKNLCDGFGDHTKTPLRRAIESNDLILSTPLEICQYLQDNCNFGPESGHTLYRRTYYYVDKNEIERNRPDRYGSEVLGLLKTHSVLGFKEGFVGLRELSCFCRNCLCEDWTNCLNKEYVALWMTKHVRREM